jgi:hypothetical protein
LHEYIDPIPFHAWSPTCPQRPVAARRPSIPGARRKLGSAGLIFP